MAMTRSIEFDPSAHVYTVDGERLPGVTQIMRPITDIAYGGVDQETMDRAAKRGTAVHNAIELYNHFGADDCPSEYAGYMTAYKKWMQESGADVTASELRVCHGILRYCGTIDIICRIRGVSYLIDVKTTKELKDKLVNVQLEAYARALEIMGTRVDRVAALHLKENGTYGFSERKAFDNKYWDVFCALLNIHWYMK